MLPRGPTSKLRANPGGQWNATGSGRRPWMGAGRSPLAVRDERGRGAEVPPVLIALPG